jgi:hypothetical protein
MKCKQKLVHLIRNYILVSKGRATELEKEFNKLMALTERELALDYAWRYVGTFYSWGGDDPSGFDCSGFVVEILKSVGLLPRKGDWTAHGLFELFQNRAVDTPIEGCLVFWHSDNKIIHVEMCVDTERSLGASGGGSGTVTREDAIKHNAFIKMRPYKSRKNIYGFVDPFKEV